MLRGRKAAQIKGLDQYDFDKLAKTEGSPRERRRFLAFAHLQEGKAFTETAAFVRVKLRSLMRWIKRFRTEGFEGLKDKPGRGKKPLIPRENQAAFRQAVLELQEKKVGGRIKGKDILELMKTKYGVDPSLKTVYNTLKRADLVWISGRSIHPKADLEAQETFKKTSQKK
ncbi:helix-turn-helix domain-containing protein [Candidatus Neptunichlamydia sp. REUL1]|uniref:helix-turn-helix domain-containing protein n=1 Tax=Candidatus Neptunichlamydia sp. REUL1 TaxID=3064277 RepID=UPI00292FC50B|nr:helix-turn-helix domain-containing protein [Candidatus Neptunochlamydia sp. REUL1]